MPERSPFRHESSDDSTSSGGSFRARPTPATTDDGGLESAVRTALGPGAPAPAPARAPAPAQAGRGGTIHLGADYLSYARKKLSPAQLKKELEARLAPLVARSPGPVPGQPFGKFQVRTLLGKGGMAEVFLARDPERDPARGQDVALKVMKDELANEPAYVRRFLREAANAALVDSENVVAIHEVGAVRGRVYFTMEVVQGQTLKERLVDGPLSEGEGLVVLRQLVNGLVAAHERGIGHRDLKPSNVMLARVDQKYGFSLQGEPATVTKIMDFGLARLYADDDEPEADAEGRILGTAKYVAPELVAGEGATLQADVFSLGIMAFQTFTGRAPWKARNKLDYLEANLRQETPSLVEAAPGVSADLGIVVAAMLEKDPAERPTTPALLRDLDRMLARKGTSPIVVRDDPTSVFFAKRAGGKGKSAPARGRLPAPWVALAILALVVAVLGALALLLGGGSPPPPPPPPRNTGPTIPLVAPPQPPAPAPAPRPEGSPDDELVPGKPPWSLVALSSGIKDEVGRTESKRALEEGDRAWADGDLTRARDRWQVALKILGAPRSLKARVVRAERELALTRAKKAEDQGRVQDALDALDEAAQKGAVGPPVDEARRRLKARRADEEAVRDAFAEAAAASGRDDDAGAIDLLRKARDPFVRLGRLPELEARIRGLEETKKGRLSVAQARKFLDDAERCLGRDELDGASVALDAARNLAPSSPEVARLGRRLARLRRAPAGTAYVELDAQGGKGLYVRRGLVTNKDYKAWLDALPPGKRKPVPWISGTFPPQESESPVKNVKPDDARAFAEARGERLPTATEREAIGRALAAPPAEGAPDARGLLGAGFRTVADPPEDRP